MSKYGPVRCYLSGQLPAHPRASTPCASVPNGHEGKPPHVRVGSSNTGPTPQLVGPVWQDRTPCRLLHPPHSLAQAIQFASAWLSAPAVRTHVHRSRDRLQRDARRRHKMTEHRSRPVSKSNREKEIDRRCDAAAIAICSSSASSVRNAIFNLSRCPWSKQRVFGGRSGKEPFVYTRYEHLPKS